MTAAFDQDPHPGAPRILFVGLAESTHTHAWIDLLRDAPLNVRLFAMPTGLPPSDWPVRTYVTAPGATAENPATRLRLSPSRAQRLRSRLSRRRFDLRVSLARVIDRWRPHVIHSLGLEPASYLLYEVRADGGMTHGRWLVQPRGGPDLALHFRLPAFAERIRSVLEHCDELVADNKPNYDVALKLGLDPAKESPLGVVPGTGGIDVDRLRAQGPEPPSRRPRLVVWPKAYECPASKALPVLEALRIGWDRIQPCEFVLLATTPEVEMWLAALPEPIRQSCRVFDRVPRAEVLDWMAQARVMLAPSLTDGIPNTLYEAMATGAAPIVSPIETLTREFEPERHVFYARNLYPEEIADALVQALEDDAGVDRQYRENLVRVRKLADRDGIAARVRERYERLAEGSNG